MKEVWVRKQTVLRARDQQALERSLCSFANALRLREGSIVDVERAEPGLADRQLAAIRYQAVIRYELPLPAGAPAASHSSRDEI